MSKTPESLRLAIIAQMALLDVSKREADATWFRNIKSQKQISCL